MASSRPTTVDGQIESDVSTSSLCIFNQHHHPLKFQRGYASYCNTLIVHYPLSVVQN
jgi:hypothetical protein